MLHIVIYVYRGPLATVTLHKSYKTANRDRALNMGVAAARKLAREFNGVTGHEVSILE